VFSRKQTTGHATLIYAATSIAAPSVAVWAQHICHRRHPATALQHLDPPDRRADRYQPLQLDRHDV
jgi:hypothetical protein